jgi:hypothetical protein
MTFKASASKHDKTSKAQTAYRAQGEEGSPQSCSYGTVIKGRQAVEEAPFPVKIFKVLEFIDAHEPDLAVIMSWQSHGNYFCIHDPEKFQDTIIPRFFFENETYSSFLRQLTLGFQKSQSHRSLQRWLLSRALSQRASNSLQRYNSHRNIW